MAAKREARTEERAEEPQGEQTTRYTADPETIRRWAEERGGKLVAVEGTGSGEDPGILRIDFPGYTGEGRLEEISWDAWFAKFEENDLALAYQEQTAGGERSNFNKIVRRSTVEDRLEEGGRRVAEPRGTAG